MITLQMMLQIMSSTGLSISRRTQKRSQAVLFLIGSAGTMKPRLTEMGLTKVVPNPQESRVELAHWGIDVQLRFMSLPALPASNFQRKYTALNNKQRVNIIVVIFLNTSPSLLLSSSLLLLTWLLSFLSLNGDF